MRIDLNGLSLGGVEREAKTKKPAGQVGSSANIEDTASLSSDTVSLASLKAQAMASPEIRQEKVAALRESIQNGTYKVEPDKIAQAILGQN
jgi:negative regulator of flagellin synthesis FlgM